MKWLAVGLLSAALLIGIIVAMVLAKKRPDYNGTRLVARVGIFGALSTILYCVPIFNIPLPFFPSFLKIHLDELPAFICGFAYGPLSGFLVLFVKTIIKLPLTNTMGVGEFGDLLLSSLYCLPATWIYKRFRTLKGAIAGMGVATVIQVLSAMLFNVYILIPFYVFMMGMEEASLLALMQKAMPMISDVKWSYGLIAVLPFNLLKDAVITVLTFVLYHFLHKPLHLEKKTPKKEVSNTTNKSSN